MIEMYVSTYTKRSPFYTMYLANKSLWLRWPGIPKCLMTTGPMCLKMLCSYSTGLISRGRNTTKNTRICDCLNYFCQIQTSEPPGGQHKTMQPVCSSHFVRGSNISCMWNLKGKKRCISQPSHFFLEEMSLWFKQEFPSLPICWEGKYQIK